MTSAQIVTVAAMALVFAVGIAAVIGEMRARRKAKRDGVLL